MPAVLEIDNLTKDYPVGFWVKRPKRALDRLCLTVQAGEVFGFLGPNGAGKTTTLNLLLRILYPTSGTARILGRKLGDPSLHQEVGYLPEQPYFYDYLTAAELLRYVGRLFGINPAALRRKVDELLEQTGLTEARDVQLRKFSKGMLQRIGIAQAILNDPQLLFLDEPFSGLDPIGRRELREIVRQLNARGVTIFFSSHILSDVESLCDRFAILHHGKLLESGTLEEALSRESRWMEIIAASHRAEMRDRLLPLASEVIVLGDRLKIVLDKDAAIAPLVEIIERNGGTVLEIHPVRPSLEELFMRQIEQSPGEVSPPAGAAL
jgi:ABC-2 type transport system ATP-binding protein